MAIVPETSTMDRHRERMLEGLAASIREQGLARTQVTDIVRHARASRTTFYKCFADKESCFIELVRVTTTVGLEAVENAVDPAAPWERQVADGVRAYFDALTAEPAIAVAVTRDLASLGTRGITVQQEGIERYAELLCRLTRGSRLRRAGVRPLSMHAAVLLIAGINTMVARAIDRGEPIGELLPTAERAVMGMLAPA
ncbi:TetR/AcrR family transcriptional regulator [Actinomadura sp. KC345]|uniref:TetR/AcrR family transcriptional regulator n=1 Tax=Actinomadura sp. KC345 TaxID=2530371 RepID=UPI0010498E1F|nr:TetR/AcrR family transcriptional regulator [Actinomadura sp. KC345]TDC56854.1 TetR/AcrR family transcriptional regulator [Actinomadura sp. KC345]